MVLGSSERTLFWDSHWLTTGAGPVLLNAITSLLKLGLCSKFVTFIRSVCSEKSIAVSKAYDCTFYNLLHPGKVINSEVAYGREGVDHVPVVGV